jgi:hypothetical protein
MQHLELSPSHAPHCKCNCDSGLALEVDHAALRRKMSADISTSTLTVIKGKACCGVFSTFSSRLNSMYSFSLQYYFSCYGRKAIMLQLRVRRSTPFTSMLNMFQLFFKVRNVVPQNSEIIEFCREGNILAVRDLLDRQVAGPNDISEDGETPLMVSYLRFHCAPFLPFNSSDSPLSQVVTLI